MTGSVLRDLEITRLFVLSKGSAYEALIGDVRAIANRLKSEMGSNAILRSYSRAEKQAGEELKEITKIVEAVDSPVTEAKLRKISDIVGLTVIVSYPDQVKPVAERMQQALEAQGIARIAEKEHAGAYYANHRIYRSTRARHQGLCCEVQCKTLLHDAWAAKMHDLTYKPQGAMDVRLRGLIEAISMTLEGLEQQSEIVRNIIVSRQLVERRPFQASLKVLHRGLYRALRDEWTSRGAMKGLEELWATIQEAEERTEELDDRDFESLAARVREAAANPQSAAVCWILAVKLVALRISPERIGLLTDLAGDLMEAAPRLLKTKLITKRELWLFPVGFYVVQDFGHAIEYADRLLAHSRKLGFDEAVNWALQFNKATWLLERETLRQSKPGVYARIGKEVSRLLDNLRADRKYSENGELEDTDGLLLIVYGATKEEVRAGIDKCNQAATFAKDEDEKAVAIAYADWRTHVGWRRYFDLAEGSPERS
jgi:ppGpp synthetase/RelA/SpoT-type nucleotidyltranferase